MRFYLAPIALFLCVSAQANVNFSPKSTLPMFIQKHIAQEILKKCPEISSNNWSVSEQTTHNQIYRVDRGLIDVSFTSTFRVAHNPDMVIRTMWARNNNDETLVSVFIEGCR